MLRSDSFIPLFSIVCIIWFAGCTGQPEVKHSDTSDTSLDSVLPSQSLSDSLSRKPETSLDNPAPIDTEEEIRTAYAATMRAKRHGSLDSSTFSYSCNGETSGQVVYFSAQGAVKMIVHKYNEYDHFSSEDQYFVEDDRPYFVYRRSVSWFFESGSEGSTKDNITERRMYLANNKPIKCLEKKFTIQSHSGNTPKSEQIASKAVDCTWTDDVEKDFRMLRTYYNVPAPDCLE